MASLLNCLPLLLLPLIVRGASFCEIYVRYLGLACDDIQVRSLCAVQALNDRARRQPSLLLTVISTLLGLFLAHDRSCHRALHVRVEPLHCCLHEGLSR